MIMGVPVLMSNTLIGTSFFSPLLVRFFRSGDIDDLAEKMLLPYNDAGLRARLANNGRVFAARNNWAEKKHEYFRLVDHLVKRPSRERSA